MEEKKNFLSLPISATSQWKNSSADILVGKRQRSTFVQKIPCSLLAVQNLPLPLFTLFLLVFPIQHPSSSGFLLIERRPEELRYGSLGGNPFGVVPGSQVQKFKFRKVLMLIKCHFSVEGSLFSLFHWSTQATLTKSAFTQG